MRNKLSKLALSVSVLLAITFNYSCSSDDAGGGVASSSSSRTTVPSSSSKAVVPSSSSKAVVQEYCVYRVTTGNGICGVIEPIGSTYNCTKGTKMDYCPYGYEMMNLTLLETCVGACPFSRSTRCSQCGGT